MATAETLPMLFVRAKSHYSVGVSIGKSFKSWIQDYMKVSADFKRFQDFYDTREGRELTEGYLAASRSCHPEIVEEIQGMADGAEVTFEDLFLLQIASEIIFCHAPEILKNQPKPANDGKGCTDVLLNRANARIIGHNDDWVKDVVERVYMVHVTITDDADNIKEQFVSYSYPGYLTGFCFGMNKHLVITLNSLLPKKANTSGVPVAVLLRCLLTCSTIDECVSVMESKPQGCAYGMCIHIASINGTEMCSMEVYPNPGKTEINVHMVPHESEDSQCFYCHQNFYKQLQTVEGDECRGSRLRDKRAAEFFPIKDKNDVLTILGDTKEEMEPIYRKANPRCWSPTVETNATAIFDITNRSLDIYRSNPKLAKSPCVTLPFL